MRDVPHEELAATLRRHRGDYGFDAPLQGLALVELLGSVILLASFSIYLHTTRRGKFAVWADVLARMDLRGDEHVLDMGCGRGAVMTWSPDSFHTAKSSDSTCGPAINPAITPNLPNSTWWRKAWMVFRAPDGCHARDAVFRWDIRSRR
jgi:hypothetical protein